MSEDKSIKKEVRKFGETVSVRGVSKVLKSQVIFLKIFWLLSVLTSLSILLWQLSAVFIKYFSYQITSTYSEGTSISVVPDVTICNIYPMADSISSQMTWHEYMDYIEQQKNLFSLSTINNWSPEWNVNASDYMDIWSTLQTPAGYFSNFPMLEDSEISNQKLITDCNFMNWDWTTDTNIDCKENIAMFWHPNYYKCYTLHLPEEFQEDVRGMSAILYVNNFPQSVSNYFGLDMRSSRGSGVRVAFHRPGTKPDMKTGISIGPGQEATVTITLTNRTRLPLPYGGSDCTKQKYLPFSDADVYTEDACFEVCLQNDVVSNCNCVDSSLKFTAQQLNQVNFLICGNQSFVENKGNVSDYYGIYTMLCSSFVNHSYDAVQ